VFVKFAGIRVSFLFCILIFPPYMPSGISAAHAAFDVNQMGDMSAFDPNNPVVPTGDPIKIANVAFFSGPAGIKGQISRMCVQEARP
jgi:hypothetical protein